MGTALKKIEVFLAKIYMEMQLKIQIDGKLCQNGAFMHNHTDKMTSPVRNYLRKSMLFCS